MALKANQTQGGPDGGEAPTVQPIGPGGPTVRSDGGPSFSLGQRFSVGVNVAVMIIAAAALLVLVNWIANREYYQDDWSSLGRYSVSDLTGKIAASIDQPIRLTILYDSQDPEKSRAKYQPRVHDLATGLRQIHKDVTITDISTPADREALAARMQKRQGAAGEEYAKLIADFAEGKDGWVRRLTEERTRLAALANNPRTWIYNFRQLRQAIAALGSSGEGLTEVAGSIDAQRAELLPNYDKQVRDIRSFIDSNLDELKTVQRDVADLAELNKHVTQDQAGGAIARTKDLSAQVDRAFAAIQAKLPGATTTQPDANPLDHFLQAAAALRAIAKLLDEEAKLLDQFVKDQPAASGISGWPVQVSMQGFPMRVPRPQFFHMLNGRLEDLADEYEMTVPQLRTETIRQALPDLVEQIGYEREQASQTLTQTEAVLVAMGGADAESRKLLDQGAAFLSDLIQPLEGLKARLDKLPELKGGGLAEQLTQDNLLLVEVGEKEPRVLGFEEVWPEVGAFELPPGMDTQKREKTRTFNGDSALGSALFALSRKPIAEVVLVHYAQAPGYPMMQQPDESNPPMSQLTELRDRLGKANLKVATWNLATEMEPPPPAYPDEDAPKDESASTQPAEKDQRTPLPRVYVVTTPPPPMSDPRMGGEQSGFGPQHYEALVAAVEDAGRALFLCGWQPSRYNPQAGLAMQTDYPWDEYLSNEWGLKVETSFRVNRGVRTRDEGRLNLTSSEINYMPLSSFNTKTAIGKPLANRRILLLHACPIEKTDAAPEGVRYETVLSVPHGDRNYFATNDFVRLLNSFQKGKDLPFEVKDDDRIPPLDVMVQAVREPNTEGRTDKSRLVVFAAGLSLMDVYMGQPVRRESESGDYNEPPPSANAEIAVNAIYWLAGQEEWIAAGPIAIPPIRIEPSRLKSIQAMVVFAWPALVLLIGGAVFLWRRKF